MSEEIKAFKDLDADHDCQVSLEEVQMFEDQAPGSRNVTLTWPLVHAQMGLNVTVTLTSLLPKDVDAGLSAWKCVPGGAQ